MNKKAIVTTLVVLAAGTLSLSAFPVGGKYPSGKSGAKAASTPACCETVNRQVLPPYRHSQATQRVLACGKSCPAHKAGHVCSSKGRAMCSP